MKDKDSELLQEKWSFLTQQGSCTFELKVLCIGAMQPQDRPNTTLETGDGLRILLIAMKPLAILASGREETVFFNTVDPGKSTTLQWKATHSRIFGHHKFVLEELKGRAHKVGWV